MIKNFNFIDGKWSKTEKRKYFVKNFYNKVISSYPNSKKISLRKAILSGLSSCLIHSYLIMMLCRYLFVIGNMLV